MNERRLLTTGVVGSTIAAIYCFTPALVIPLGAVGLTAWLAWADSVLLPAQIVFLGMTGYALHLRRQRAAAACCGTETAAEQAKEQS